MSLMDRLLRLIVPEQKKSRLDWEVGPNPVRPKPTVAPPVQK